MKIVHHDTFGGQTPRFEDRKHSFSPRTVVMEDLPSLQEVLDASKYLLGGGSPSFSVLIGVSKLHPRDQFSRKEGLRLATSRMARVDLWLENVSVHQSEVHVAFKTQDGRFCALKYTPTGRVELKGNYL